MSELVHLNGWDLFIDGDEPRVRDIDIAEQAGLAQPRDIRKTIEKNRKELEAHGALEGFALGERKPLGGRPGTEYRLNEAQAISLVALMKTAKAMQLRIALVQVFVSFRKGQLPVSSARVGLDIAHGPRVGEVLTLRDKMKRQCQIAARSTGRSIQAVHGAVRRTWLVPSIYNVSVLAWPHVSNFIDDIALGRLLIPRGKGRPLQLVARDPRQLELVK